MHVAHTTDQTQQYEMRCDAMIQIMLVSYSFVHSVAIYTVCHLYEKEFSFLIFAYQLFLLQNLSTLSHALSRQVCNFSS